MLSIINTYRYNKGSWKFFWVLHKNIILNWDDYIFKK